MVWTHAEHKTVCLFPQDGVYILCGGGGSILRHSLASTGLFVVLCVGFNSQFTYVCLVL